ncbi:transmembrane protein 187-like [Asterias rubens]|uniref:transmembrane protein 187-like n=1 Tax=Asterias rubens TaxID=7604 RepID=UPI0014551700|nr:transmembrane protein 187-like [Asterias rubens]XP_033647587.1 transmembrane protein 187-like [Asterias rubens]
MGSMAVLMSLLPVVVSTSLMIMVVSHGIFDPIKVDLGFEHYAEKPDFTIGSYKLPDWLKLAMPLNALVNIGYVIIGFYWIFRTYFAERNKTVGSLHAYFAYTFAWMSIVYGPIQLGRILYQTHPSAILDQWVTLPFFTLVILWSKSFIIGWNLNVCLMFMLSSILSYNLVFFSEFGFEVSLILHAASVLNAMLAIHGKYTCEGNIKTLMLTFLAFVMFILFKVLDLHLPRYGDVFTEVSGHFLSKLFGDIAQIQCVFVFFENIAQNLQASALLADLKVKRDDKVTSSRKKKR